MGGWKPRGLGGKPTGGEQNWGIELVSWDCAELESDSKAESDEAEKKEIFPTHAV